MRRRLAHPYGKTVPATRFVSLLMGLALLGVLYQRAKDPQFWFWLTNESRTDSANVSKPVSSIDDLKTRHSQLATLEEIIPGPNETDADELTKFRSNLKAVQDRQPLQSFDMPAYWQLMRWSRTRPFAEHEKLARRDVPYSHLWDEPDLYRGQPIRLKLYVRRVLKYEPSKNPQDLKMVYEAWGWTDDSRSFPFCVVFPDKPEGLKIGTDVESEIVFVGYFLKWMSYSAFDVKKNSPLLVGRVRPATQPVGGANGGAAWESAFLMLVGGVLLLSFIGWFAIYGMRRPRTIIAATTALPDQLPENWSVSSTAESAFNRPVAELVFVEAASVTTPLPTASPASPTTADTPT